MAKRVERAMIDPNQLSVKAEIAVLGVRLDQLAGRLFESETPPDTAKVRKLTSEVVTALEFGNHGAARAAGTRLLKALDSYESERQGWQEYRETVRDLAALAKQESISDDWRKTFIPAAEVYAFVGAFQMLMHRYIDEPERKRQFAVELRHIFPTPRKVNGLAKE
jgi:uncharacterized protein YjiS (DUF1127 family)